MKKEEVEARVWNELRQVFDPEIPVNIVDLGLIYSLNMVPDEKEGFFKVQMRMTLTAPGCAMGDFIKADAVERLARTPGVASVEADLVFDPPWDMSRMSPAAKLQLGMY